MRSAIGLLLLFFVNASFAQTGPAGVGSSDGSSSLKLWFRPDYGVNTTGTAVDSWTNAAGIPALDVAETGSQRPTLVAGALNGFAEISFNGSNRLRTGLTLTPSNFVTDEASSFVVARADNTTQTSSVYCTDPLELNRFSTHIPWDGTVYFDIGNCCGNDTRLDVGGLTGLTGYSVWSFDANPSSGKQLYRNGALLQTRPLTGTYSSHPSQRFNIGSNTGGSNGFVGDVAEVIIFKNKVNEAQRILIQNYLSAKYSLPLSANDVYRMDDGTRGNYDFDVAGIGRVGTGVQDDSRGTGVVRVRNPSSLGDGDFMMWGHDNGNLSATVTTGLPSSVTARFEREWRVSEVGEVGTIDIEFDLGGLPDFAGMDDCEIALALRLLLDTDGDGYADQSPMFGATHIGNNIFRFTNVSPVEDGDRFTLGIYNPAVNGPGGVGGTNGTSSLVLWLDANQISGTNGATITTWNDMSGYGNHFTSGNGAVYNTNDANGYPTFTFNGSSHYFERPFTASLTPNTFTIVSANRVNSSSSHKTVISNRDDPTGNETRGFILYAIPSSNHWSFWNGHATIPWQQTTSSVSTAGSWAAITAAYRSGTDGKQLYIDNLLEETDTHTLNPNTVQPIRVGAGRNEWTPDYYFNGSMGELILYNTVLNAAERIIVNNYLAAKYGFTLADDDIYTRDLGGQGNFDHDVAGIGRLNSTNLHRDSRGTGRVRVLNPTGLSDDEWFFWGHNNADIGSIEMTDVPTGIQGRLSRVWRVSEQGNMGSADLYFDMTGMGPVTLSDLRLLIDNDGDFSNGGTTQLTGTALACNQYAFSIPAGSMNGHYFTLGTRNLTQTPLPITLASFTGAVANGSVELQWTTLTETDNHFFAVERSTDGKHFHSIGEVDGMGTTREVTDYTFEDTFPPYGVLYYRLKQTDFDLHYSYSDVIRVENKVLGTQLVAIPNPAPAAEPFRLRVRHTESIDLSDSDVRAFDLMGHTVTVATHVDGQDLLVSFPEETAPGLYLITVATRRWAPLSVRVILR